MTHIGPQRHGKKYWFLQFHGIQSQIPLNPHSQHQFLKKYRDLLLSPFQLSKLFFKVRICRNSILLHINTGHKHKLKAAIYHKNTVWCAINLVQEHN